MLDTDKMDMQSGLDKMKAESAKRLASPTVGDYWEEMLVGICVVVARFPGHVVICKEKISTDDDHWTWDLTKLKMMSLEEFREWLSYGSIPGTWAYSYGKRMDWVTEALQELQQEEADV